MSKLNRIDFKRRFHSFLIYILVSVWILCGCATRPSEGINPAADVASQPNVNQAAVSQNDATGGNRAVTELAEVDTSESAAIQKGAEAKEYTESKPRIFIKPSDSELGQVLGIDFSMMPHEKSRLTLTTNKKVDYDLDSVSAKTLNLNIYNSQIGLDVLLRHIDTTEFQTALEKIDPSFDKVNNKITLNIVMREVVPYTVKQFDDSLIIDFDRMETRIAEKKITPLNLVEAETRNLAAVTEQEPAPAVASSSSKETPQAEIQAFSPSVDRKYTGAKLDLTFADEDVTNILRLINDVSGENIIWDPDIKGKKVSMILKDVPWDEALELIMKNNELAKRYVGQNIVWITSKQKMAQILAEEEAESRKLQEKLDQEREKLLEQKKRVEDDSPLVTEYIPVDFAKADEIKDHIILTKRGKISIETNTNTIIITDTASSIEEAIKIRNRFDIPVKQIMIEARIVDATEDFSRDMGLRWTPATSVSRTSSNNQYDGSFSTNAPEGWSSNIGLNWTKTTGNGSLALDAALALAENEGKAKVMSAPKVIAREGASATISSGDKIIIPAAENVQSTTLDATLSLTVTPASVSYNDFITLEVDVTDDQAPTTTRILKKAINTTLMVKSGETVVIGGIIKESQGEEASGIPIIKDAPLLGWLFKSKRKTHQKSELLIFLTPTVLPSPVKKF